jgi:hypothetical protein
MGRHLRDHLLELHGKGFHDAFCHGMSGGAWYDFLDPQKNGIANEFNNPNSVLRAKVLPKVAHEFKDPNSVLRGKVIPIGAKVASYAQPFVDAAVPGLGTAINTGFKAANYANEGAKALGYGGKRRGRPRKGGRNHPASEVARATTMVEHTKKGRNRNNGVPLLSGNVDGVWSGGSMLDQPMPVVGTNISLSDAPNMSGKGMTGAYEGQGKRRRAPAGANDGRRKRAEIVKRVMNEKGLSMINASKYVKEHGLY